jgi:apolipoprotein N-acyltransferase
VSTYYEQPRAVGIAFFAGCATTMAAPYYAAFVLLYRRIATRAGWLVPFATSAAWVAAELGRGRLFTGTPFFIGNPWGLIGYSQVGLPWLMQTASIAGVYGMSFVVVCVNAALAETWLEPTARRTRIRSCAVALLPAIAAILHGMLVLPPPEAAGPGTPIAIVQANLDLGSAWQSDFYGRNLDEYLRLTQSVQRATHPRVVFWPEGAMTFLLEREPLYRAAIGNVLAQGDTELVAGGPTVTPAGQPERFFNTIFLLQPDGEVRARYDKEYLVPFAEYFPLASLDCLRRRFERVRVFHPGSTVAPLPTAIGPAAIATCNEGMLPEVVARRVADGATFIVNPSNDTWTADPTYSALQFDIVTLRAVEQRRYLVRPSTAGPSAIVDPWGRIVVETAPFTRAVISGRIVPRTDTTLYARTGDLFAVLCAVAAFALAGRHVA